MTKTTKWLVAGVAAAVALGCAHQVDTSDPAPPADPESPAREHVVHVALRLSVPDVFEAARALRRAVEAHEGYVESATERPSSSGGDASFELRVPAAAASDLRVDLEALGDVERESEEAADVTAEHRDLSTRIASAHAEQARLAELMALRTDDRADVLAVERELSRVTESIEQLEASERDLSARVAMARVSVELAPARPGFAEDPLGRLADASTAGLTAARVVALSLGVAVAALAPTVLLLALLGALVRRLSRAVLGPAPTRAG